MEYLSSYSTMQPTAIPRGQAIGPDAPIITRPHAQAPAGASAQDNHPRADAAGDPAPQPHPAPPIHSTAPLPYNKGPRATDRKSPMKRILLIATGGTIASMEEGDGLSPALTGSELAACVPEIEGLCKLTVVQPMNIDSTNMRPADWLHIRDVIMDAYDDHDGFLILHGTDTMSYTAAALSYLIQQSPKPIVLTGSQRPMMSPFTDAKLNLYQSLLWAVDDRARDVAIVFGGLVIAGTRARKQRTMSANAFTSVTFHHSPTSATIASSAAARRSPAGPSTIACSRPRPRPTETEAGARMLVNACAPPAPHGSRRP